MPQKRDKINIKATFYINNGPKENTLLCFFKPLKSVSLNSFCFSSQWIIQ